MRGGRQAVGKHSGGLQNAGRTHHLPTGVHQFKSRVATPLTFKIFRIIFARSSTYSGGPLQARTFYEAPFGPPEEGIHLPLQSDRLSGYSGEYGEGHALVLSAIRYRTTPLVSRLKNVEKRDRRSKRQYAP